MTEYGDKIDKVRTELARHRSLLKAQVQKNSILISQNSALRSDLHRLDELMSAIAMEWVKLPEPSPQEPRSPLDLAIMAAAQETTGMHRRGREGEEND